MEGSIRKLYWRLTEVNHAEAKKGSNDGINQIEIFFLNLASQ